MRFFRFLVLLFWLLLGSLIPLAPSWAGVDQLSREEFQDLSHQLSLKVDLFRDAWQADPKVEFYGGSARDFLYWVKGNFRSANTREEALRVKNKLLARPLIEAREFIVGESDIDVLSGNRLQLEAKKYGVLTIDTKPPSVADPLSELGKSERLQGHIPAEKIRLAKNGFIPPADLGDGLGEIYRGKFTAHFTAPEIFAQSKYAQEGINHPILLALRYLRLQATNYYQTHGSGYPDKATLLASFDPATRKEVEKVISGAIQSNELTPFLEKERFRKWFNSSIQKAFRSYTNPTAALLLMKEFGVDKLQANHANKVDGFNNLLFAKFRDQEKIKAALAQFGVKEKEFFLDPKTRFPDGFLYHGTLEQNFRNILLQGSLPSEGGLGGEGLYGTGLANRNFAENYRNDPQHTVKFPVKENAKIVDITTGEGKRIYDKFLPGAKTKKPESEFAELFGVDIVRYPYHVEAYVVKNSAALEKPQGLYKQVMPLAELVEWAKKTKNLAAILETLSLNNFTAAELALFWKSTGLTNEDIWAALATPANEVERKTYKEFAFRFLPEKSLFPNWELDPKIRAAYLEFGFNPVFLIQTLAEKRKLLEQPAALKDTIPFLKNTKLHPPLQEKIVAEITSNPAWIDSPILLDLASMRHLAPDLAKFALQLPVDKSLPLWEAIIQSSIEGSDSLDVLLKRLSTENLDPTRAQKLLSGIAKSKTASSWLSHALSLVAENPNWIGSIQEKNFLLDAADTDRFLSQRKYVKDMPWEAIVERMPIFVGGKAAESNSDYFREIFFSKPESVKHPQIFFDALKSSERGKWQYTFIDQILEYPHWAKRGDIWEKALQSQSKRIQRDQLERIFRNHQSDPEMLLKLSQAAVEGVGADRDEVYLQGREFVKNPAHRKQLDATFIDASVKDATLDQAKLYRVPEEAIVGIIEGKVAAGQPLGSDAAYVLGDKKGLRSLPATKRLSPLLLEALKNHPHAETMAIRLMPLVMGHPDLRKNAELVNLVLSTAKKNPKEFKLSKPVALSESLAPLSPSELREIPNISGAIRELLLDTDSHFGFSEMRKLVQTLLTMPEYQPLFEKEIPFAKFFSQHPVESIEEKILKHLEGNYGGPVSPNFLNEHFKFNRPSEKIIQAYLDWNEKQLKLKGEYPLAPLLQMTYFPKTEILEKMRKKDLLPEFINALSPGPEFPDSYWKTLFESGDLSRAIAGNRLSLPMKLRILSKNYYHYAPVGFTDFLRQDNHRIFHYLQQNPSIVKALEKKLFGIQSGYTDQLSLKILLADPDWENPKDYARLKSAYNTLNRGFHGVPPPPKNSSFLTTCAYKFSALLKRH